MGAVVGVSQDKFAALLVMPEATSAVGTKQAGVGSIFKLKSTKLPLVLGPQGFAVAGRLVPVCTLIL